MFIFNLILSKLGENSDLILITIYLTFQFTLGPLQIINYDEN